MGSAEEWRDWFRTCWHTYRRPSWVWVRTRPSGTQLPSAMDAALALDCCLEPALVTALSLSHWLSCLGTGALGSLHHSDTALLHVVRHRVRPLPRARIRLTARLDERRQHAARRGHVRRACARLPVWRIGQPAVLALVVPARVHDSRWPAGGRFARCADQWRQVLVCEWHGMPFANATHANTSRLQSRRSILSVSLVYRAQRLPRFRYRESSFRTLGTLRETPKST